METTKSKEREKDLIMKNELGIEVCCANCYLIFDCNLPVENACRINGQHLSFMPSIEACSTRIKEMQKLMREEADAIDIGVSALNTYYEARIKKIQEQQFTEDELHIIINMISILLGQDHSLYDSLLTPLSKKLKRMINER